MWFGNGIRPQNNLAGYSRNFGSSQTGVHTSSEMKNTLVTMEQKIDWMSVLIGAVGVCIVWSIMTKKK